MRIVLKTLYKALSILLMVGAMVFTLMPATEAEAAALGRDNNRFMLIQMRLAKTMLTVAPDFAVARYAEATGLPPDMMRAMLEAKAAGASMSRHNAGVYADSGDAAAPIDRSRRTEAGGALFAKPD